MSNAIPAAVQEYIYGIAPGRCSTGCTGIRKHDGGH
jgi:hypothetical protein